MAAWRHQEDVSELLWRATASVRHTHLPLVAVDPILRGEALAHPLARGSGERGLHALASESTVPRLNGTTEPLPSLGPGERLRFGSFTTSAASIVI